MKDTDTLIPNPFANPEDSWHETDTAYTFPDPDPITKSIHDRINELPLPEDAYAIKITQDTVIFADPKTGIVFGPKAEGTLGIILYGERVGSGRWHREGAGQNARAIRIPRLLSSDILLNFHIAEISNCEGLQAALFTDLNGLLGAISYFRLNIPNNFTQLPHHSGNAFLGFYLSPSFQYKVCLLARDKAWPEDFASYLTDIGKTPADIFDMVLDKNTSYEPNFNHINPQNLNHLVFIPHYSNKGIKSQCDQPSSIWEPRTLSRDTLHVTSKERNISGWWFNLPIALYSWMTADLQRLLTATVEGGEDTRQIKNEIDIIKAWKLVDWFQLFKTLATGFYHLHTRGAIHGDSRPANIMFQASPNGKILPESFQWIDIGLGYEIDITSQNETGQTSITPRPLGGSRTTPFYAPERIEGRELEDADHIRLNRVVFTGNTTDKQEELFKLSFYFKQKTDHKLTGLKLKEIKNGKEKPIRELGELHEGDRIQVREFLFVVKEVKEYDILVSKIYEILLDRVLIDKTIDTDSCNAMLETLRSASISRYRIFKHWSQATDIYGLGNTILYTLFMIGFFRKDESIRKKNTQTLDIDPEKSTPNSCSVADRSPRESIFNELSQTLRSETFLIQFLQKLAANGYVEKESIWDKEILNAKRIKSHRDKNSTDKGIDKKVVSDPNTSKEEEFSRKISNIADQIIVFDNNFNYVYAALDCRIGLFVQVIYFCLCCVWREEAWIEIKAKEENMFDFQPFCKSRLKIPAFSMDIGTPAEKAKERLDTIIRNILNMPDDPSRVNEFLSDYDGVPDSRDRQNVKLQKEIDSLNRQIEDMKKKMEETSRDRSHIHERESEISALKHNLDNLEQEKSELYSSYIKMLAQVERNMFAYYDQRKKSKTLNLPGIKEKIRIAEEYLRITLLSVQKELKTRKDRGY